jgi:hypothetical protein
VKVYSLLCFRFVVVSDSQATYDDTAIAFMTGQIFGSKAGDYTNFTYGAMMTVMDSERHPVLVSNYTGIHVEQLEGNYELQAYLTSMCDILDGQSSLMSWDATFATMYQDHEFLIFGTEEPLHGSAGYDDDYWPIWSWNDSTWYNYSTYSSSHSSPSSQMHELSSRQLASTLVKGKAVTSKLIATQGVFPTVPGEDSQSDADVYDYVMDSMGHYQGQFLMGMLGKVRGDSSDW